MAQGRWIALFKVTGYLQELYSTMDAGVLRTPTRSSIETVSSQTKSGREESSDCDRSRSQPRLQQNLPRTTDCLKWFDRCQFTCGASSTSAGSVQKLTLFKRLLPRYLETVAALHCSIALTARTVLGAEGADVVHVSLCKTQGPPRR